jgi:Carboxypeptidase regulatory-like domain/TonB-dependent Receptor Plug Domain
MKKLIMMMAILTTGSLFGQSALGEVVGTVLQKGTKNGVYGAVAYIDDNGNKYQARTDFDGSFRISAIPAGTYLLSIKYQGDTLQQQFQVIVPMDGIARVDDIQFTSEILTLTTMIVKADDGSMKLEYGSLPVKTLDSKQIGRSPDKNNIKSLIVSVSTDVRMTNDGELVFRGARKGDMLYMMDGVKTSSIGSVPSSSIGRMMVYAGGLPAKYGDTMGGVVVMESKSYFDLYRSWEASQLMKED